MKKLKSINDLRLGTLLHCPETKAYFEHYAVVLETSGLNARVMYTDDFTTFTTDIYNLREIYWVIP